ncbi:MAG: hypothetical protein JW821_18850, partial [Deltaproteobacteria bacterium]|nr:hypothetical protein [Deltaproteobacteria bacterium]
TWEETVIGRDVSLHDVVVCSRAFTMEDAGAALEKMDRAARRFVYLTWRASDRPLDRAVSEALTRPYREYPDYIYLVNILHQMGILANVAFIACPRVVRYGNTDEVLAHWRAKLGGLSPDEENTLIRVLPRILIQTGGDGWESPHFLSRWALMWWAKKASPGDC